MSTARHIIEAIEWQDVSVTERALFTYVTLRSADGLFGLGEASLIGKTDKVHHFLKSLSQRWQGRSIEEPFDFQEEISENPADLVCRAAASAFETALLDLRARQQRSSIRTLIGEPVRDQIPYYANINRGTKDRSLEGWLKRVSFAMDSGFKALKLAPFSVPTNDKNSGKNQGYEEVLDLLRTIRETAGDELSLMVDCHWKLDTSNAEDFIKDSAPLNISWIEAIIPETEEHIPKWRELRHLAADHGIRLSGGEYALGYDALSPFVIGGAFDVINPDIRFFGFEDMMRIARLAADEGVRFSPHNPMGPIMDLTSAHLCSCTPGFEILEVQFGEGDPENDYGDRHSNGISGGIRQLSDTPGLGLALEGDRVKVT